MKKCTQIDKVRSTTKNISQIDKVRNTSENNLKIDKPLVSILLAVYKPNEKWLIEQLISLNEQSYPNLNLIVYDDCPEYPVNEELFDKYITNFDFKILRGHRNKGSNKAFEELTKVGSGEYFAYCDQDDIWEKNKIEELINTSIKEQSLLTYSDMVPINEYNDIIADTLIKVKPRISYDYGDNLLIKLFFKNFISGCSMVVKKDIALKAVPFSTVTIHDQWISMIASVYGRISFVNRPLVRYRIHSNNQTKSLMKIWTKNDYYTLRINVLETRLIELEKCINNLEEDKVNIIEKICSDRKSKNLFGIIKYRKINKREAYFEIIIKYLPNWLFKILIKKLK